MCSTVQEQITTCGQNAIVKIGERTNIRPQKGKLFDTPHHNKYRSKLLRYESQTKMLTQMTLKWAKDEISLQNREAYLKNNFISATCSCCEGHPIRSCISDVIIYNFSDVQIFFQ